MYFVMICCTVLHCTALHCTALHCTAPHCTALHCTALYCTVQHYIALYCIVLHCIVLCCAVLYGILCCAVVRCAVVLLYIVLRSSMSSTFLPSVLILVLCRLHLFSHQFSLPSLLSRILQPTASHLPSMHSFIPSASSSYFGFVFPLHMFPLPP